MAARSHRTGVGGTRPVSVKQSAQPVTINGVKVGHGDTSHMVWLRSNHPFHGEGQRMMLEAVKGLTPRGWLSVPFRFQHTPLDSWSRTITHNWANFQVVGGDSGAHERTRSGGPALRTYTTRTLFTDWDTPFQVWSPDTLEPVLAVRELEELCRRGIVFHLKLQNAKLFSHNDVSWTAVLTQVQVEEQSGEPDTRYVTLNFQEFDQAEAKRTTRGPWSHTIKDGDTLYKLARHYYGQQSLWPLIAAANSRLHHWAPSRDLVKWSKDHHKKRLTVPAKPDRGKHKVDGHVVRVH